MVYLENKSKKINGVFGTAFGYKYEEQGSKPHAVSDQQSSGLRDHTCTGLNHGMLEANKSVEDIVEKVRILLKKLNAV